MAKRMGREKGLSVRTALIGWFGCCFLTWHWMYWSEEENGRRGRHDNHGRDKRLSWTRKETALWFIPYLEISRLNYLPFLWVNYQGKTMLIPCYSSLRLLSITENRYRINLYSFFLSWNNKQTQGKIIVFLFLWLNSLASSRPQKKNSGKETKLN